MIVSITGKLIKKEPSQVVIDVNGLGYLCLISTNTFDILPGESSEVSLLTYYHVTENSQELFGFSSESERILFKMLIGVSGIGPKTAIALLSAVTPDEFRQRIIAGEVSMLTALPGIGPKTARRIIVELKDKFVKWAEDELPVESGSTALSKLNEASTALVSLGFRLQEAMKILQQIHKESPELETEELIRKALSSQG